MRSIEIPQPEDRGRGYRLFEILPGFLTYLILSMPLVLGIISPRAAAYFIIAYILIWFFRVLGLNIRVLQGWRRMNHDKKLDWLALNDDLESLEPRSPGAPRWHAPNLERVARNIGHNRIKPSQVYHAVIIAFWNEGREILEPTIQSIIDSDYDKKKVILVLAYEQRGGPEAEATALSLVQDYGRHFHHAEAVMHPWPMAGELIGKGGNITYAGRWLAKYLKQALIDPLHVMVTTLDSDNRVDKKYLAALTYTYCSTEEPKHASYQPIPVFTNNIWDAPAPMRIIATGNSFWNIVLSLRPHALRNFSSHAQPMAALIDTDYWSVRTIVEDGHQFWRTFFRYDGKHDVFPVYVPIYQDAVLAETIKRTFKAQFIQLRRWAWGASDIAYVINQTFFKPNHIPKWKVLPKLARLIENHVSWSTAPLILLFAALVPFFLDQDNFIANQLPQVASKVQMLATIGIIVSLFLGFKMLPPKPARYKRRRTAWMVLQWAMLPLTTIVYGSCAALYSQTRLMFGWYLGWIITEKAVKK